MENPIPSLSSALREKLGHDLVIHSKERVSGGDINQASFFKTNKGVFFLKYQEGNAFPNMFEAENKGLDSLRESDFTVPKSFGPIQWEGGEGLLLEWIVSGRKSSDFWVNFGTCLAHLHKITHSEFGWEEDNYIGSLPQRNTPEPDWISFFVNQRLDPLLAKAVDANPGYKHMIGSFEKLYHKLDRWVPEEKPALLHGDLWSGNYLIDEKGWPCLIDPAVYYGHREVDLAMTHLFGGFDSSYIESYHKAYPLQEGWQERLDLHNLYPLLVHLILFGGGYARQIEQLLKRYI